MIGLRKRDVVIDESIPFKGDILGREESAIALTNIIKTVDEPMVLCINAPWGQGKTTFLKMWEQSLKNDHFTTVYFNAWESDFSDDALVCLIGELDATLKSSADNSKLKEALADVKSLGIALSKRVIPLAAKIIIQEVVDNDEYKSIAASFAESLAKDQVEKYTKAKSSISKFKTSLSKLADSATKENSSRPLVFIIDELDRCRPAFAIEVLEKAKHFFNADNVVFILAVDKEQLGSSFKAIYGQDLDIANYLRRFFDLEYTLPYPQIGAFTKVLFDRFEISDLLKKKEITVEDDDIEACLAYLFDSFSLTLREQEHCCALLSLAIRVSKPKEDLLLVFLSFLIAIKVKFPDLYSQWVNSDKKPDFLTTEASSRLSEQQKRDLLWVEITTYTKCLSFTDEEDFSYYCSFPDEEMEMKLDQRSNFQYESEYVYGKEKISITKKVINILSKRISNHESTLGFLVAKIDLISNFQESLREIEG
jgi:hypothetical protein